MDLQETYASSLGAEHAEATHKGRRVRRAPWLLAGSREGLAQLPKWVSRATEFALHASHEGAPLPAGKPLDVLAATRGMLGELSLDGVGAEAALRQVARALFTNGLDLTHPHAAAHLQPAPLAIAVAADMLASVCNASLDTYDSGPSAIAIERWLIGLLTRMARLGAHADGVLTPGGSLSNLLALLLARDRSALRRSVDARRQGVGALGASVVFCSEYAHFSTHRACATLGLGEAAVRAVPCDANRRMRPGALAALLRDLPRGHTPLALVATAGTTDFGSIDPLRELGEICAEHDLWFHVDAAYGFGALFSERLSGLLDGIERADSITLDLHKLGWQPAAASVLLVSDTKSFSALERQVPYLNPCDDGEAGLDGLLGRSLQTTRRADALKIVATLLAYGRRGIGDMVDACHELARHAEQRIAHEPRLELVAGALLTTVVFRYRTRGVLDARGEDELNARLRRHLLERGTALIGRTTTSVSIGGAPRVCLKLTLLNPTATSAEIDGLIDAVLAAGHEVDAVDVERLA